MYLYCLYDKLAEEAGPVFEAVNDAIALRNVRQMVSRNGLDESEYYLYKIGEYSSKLPSISAYPKAVVVNIPPIVREKELF